MQKDVSHQKDKGLEDLEDQVFAEAERTMLKEINGKREHADERYEQAKERYEQTTHDRRQLMDAFNERRRKREAQPTIDAGKLQKMDDVNHEAGGTFDEESDTIHTVASLSTLDTEDSSRESGAKV